MLLVVSCPGLTNAMDDKDLMIWNDCYDVVAAAFFTTYEVLKGLLPEVIDGLKEDSMAPILHMLSASGGEIVRLLLTRVMSSG